jgi:hypothetical protein
MMVNMLENANRVTQRCTLLCPTADLTFFECCRPVPVRQHSQAVMPGQKPSHASR